ncbi:MAG: tetratricopeptide repeat protein [Betaproteobacteria bacterium]|nr:tetratricopeptide repeat protein [Betaproteobacteria bacterium]
MTGCAADRRSAEDPIPTGAPGRDRHELLVPCALLVACVITAYANAIGTAYQFDDWNVIVDNRLVHSWSAWWAHMPGIRPLLKATYTANWTSGFGVRGFHVVNVLLHALNTCLALFVVRRVLRRCGLRAPEALGAAFTAAVVFALHPAQTEAVTYVSGRSVSLMAACYLAGLLCHLVAPDRARPLRWRVAASVFFVLALGVKEIAWTFPVAVLAVERAGHRRWRDAFRATRPYWILLVTAGVAATFIPRYWWLLGKSLEVRPLGENLLTQVDGQFYLLTRVLFGLVVNVDPDLPVRTHFAADLVAKAATVGAAIAAALWQWRRRPWLGLGILWVFVHLLATNTILPRLDVANDRQLYLAMLGPGWILGVLACRTRLARVVPVVLAGVLGWSTVSRNADYATEVSLWEATAKASPGKARVWNNLGYVRQLAGDVAGARSAYERALAIDPDNIKARINLGTLDASGAAPPAHRD